MEKCVSLGVPPGPLLGELKAGRDIVLDDGTVVKASDVVDASTEKPQVTFLSRPHLLSKLLRNSINGHYRFERILGKILSSLDTDDTENGL